ncbi:MAG: phosphoenolpyruvate--protein phosphotransferase [Eubacterium sp.]
MIVATGKSIVKGIAITKIRVLKEPDRRIDESLHEDTDAQVKRFEDAVAKVIDQQNELYERAKETAGEKNAEIFEVHAMMLEDEDLIDDTEEIIREQKRSAEYAVKESFTAQAKVFEEMDDAYLSARSADIYDLENAVLDVLLGIDPDSFMPDEPFILVADDLAPSETVKLDKNLLQGIVTRGGSQTSHTAILARSMNVPALIQVKDISEDWDGKTAIVDGYQSCIYVDPTPETMEMMLERREADRKEQALLQDLIGKESRTVDGTEVRIYANIGGPADLPAVKENDAEGVGLFRSEFVYLNGDQSPTEEEQFQAYKSALEALAPKQVVIRTCDIGADKQVDYLNLDPEDNPALGFRAIRICLTRKEFFKTQLRALLRASAFGNLAVMFPMITSLKELMAAKEILEECRTELKNEGQEMGSLEIGIMIETPAAALIADDLARQCDFFSIGTNDLTQYTLAIDRQNAHLEPFLDTHHPAVLKEIKMAVDAAHRHGIWCGICGELGADLELTETFLRMGIDELSVNPKSVLPLRKQVRGIDLSLPEEKQEEDFR